MWIYTDDNTVYTPYSIHMTINKHTHTHTHTHTHYKSFRTKVLIQSFSITTTTTVQKVEPVERPASTDSRSQLMDQIRSGIKLKIVSLT